MLILGSQAIADWASYLPYLANILLVLGGVAIWQVIKWIYQKHKASRPKPTWNK